MLIFCRQGTIICCGISFSDKGRQKGNLYSIPWIWCGDIITSVLSETYSFTLPLRSTAAVLLPKGSDDSTKKR